MKEEIDPKPGKLVEDAQDDGSDKEEVLPVQPFKYYLQSDVTYKIVTTRWGLFTVLGGCCYVYELCWTVAGVNNYTDITRTFPCGSVSKTGTPQDIQNNASAIYDLPILLTTLWHMIEWLRWAVLLTTALVDANMIKLFYFLCLNIPFGFILCIIVIIGRFSGNQNADDCLELQGERARYLSLQIVCFFLYFVISISWFWFYKVKGVDWLHEVYLDEGDDDDD